VAGRDTADSGACWTGAGSPPISVGINVAPAILEERRELINERIGSKNEGALFSLANIFAICHQRRGQQGDYDPAFLDWIFWWYFRTIEFADRLLGRQDSEEEPE
jgi:hypothetical protein